MNDFPKLMKSNNGLVVAFTSKVDAVVVDSGKSFLFEKGDVMNDFWFIDELTEDGGPRIWSEV